MKKIANSRNLAIGSLLLGISLLFVGCDADYNFTQKQSALDPKGPVAELQLDVMKTTLYVTGFLFVTVGGALVYTVWRFRKKPSDDPNFIPNQSHGNPLVEVGLIGVSCLMLVFMGIPTVKGIIFMKEIPEQYNEDVLEINVIGYQWWWMFEYPQLGVTTSNEMIIPTNRTVKLNLRSADVIHSFWLPKLAGKTDLIPGQENTMWIYADESGEYWGQCAEYCGDSHAYMLFRAFAKSSEAFDEWAEKQREAPAEPPTTLALQGKELFLAKGCVECHKIGEVGGVIAPDLTHFGSRTTLGAGWLDNTPENLKQWISASETIKPGNLMYERVQKMNLTPDEVDALEAYLTNLK